MHYIMCAYPLYEVQVALSLCWFLPPVMGHLSNMMTSPNWNIFYVTGPLWGESTRATEQPVKKTVSMSVMWDTIMLIMMSL